MALTMQQKNLHLLNRAGFGVIASDISSIAAVNPSDLLSVIEKKSQGKPQYFDVADNMVKGLLMGVGDVVEMQKKVNDLSKEAKQQIKQQSREDLKSLNLTWMDEMVSTNAQLREKISLFWHGHFACRDINIFFQQQLLDDVRNNSLGNFGDLLKAVSKSASMLGFLNNQQNRKSHPNENFAREVMELFTLGRGNYTENDVKEAARAFTGWGFNLNGDFVFRRVFHDAGSKTILGRTGNFNGDDVLNILLEQKQTSKFITEKLYKFFVNDTIDKEKTNWLAERFYQSGYNISSLIHDIFSASWFYDDKNVGAKIKSPVELIVGIRRLLPMEIDNEAILLVLQRALGQLLFYPPNVAGWAGGKSWIDSSTLMLRLRLPQLIKDDDTFYLNPKADDDQQMGMKETYAKKAAAKSIGAGGFQVHANVDWQKYIQQFNSVPREKLYDVLESIVLGPVATTLTQSIVQGNINSASREEYIRSATIALMSTPEYQLC
jgi:uncharacterized protein (DUF1800 family)